MANVTSQKANFEAGAYSYRAYWNGKEYSGGRRFVQIIGVDNSREYTIVANAAGELLESKVASESLAKAAIEALGWK